MRLYKFLEKILHFKNIFALSEGLGVSMSLLVSEKELDISEVLL